jgi:hypothetical protein
MNTLLQVPRRDGVFHFMQTAVKLLEFSLRFQFFPVVHHVLILDCCCDTYGEHKFCCLKHLLSSLIL